MKPSKKPIVCEDLILINEYVPGTNIMAGTNITRAGTNIMTRNEYYRILTFRLEHFLPGTNIMRHLHEKK